MPTEATNDDAAVAFWEDRYRKTTRQSTGRPSASLPRYAADEPPGHALELGCGKGDDAIWLARRGWRVTAVDISETVLGYARENAVAAGVAEQIDFRHHDLAESFPAGRFDLVTAQFLQSPMEFGRERVLGQAAAAVAPGGLLLVGAHASGPPWGDAKPDTRFPTLDEELAALALDPAAWTHIFVGTPEREMTGPEGQTAMVKDIIVVARRTA